MMSEEHITILLTVMGSTLASSGFWAYLQSRNISTSSQQKMLLGLAHDRIMTLSMDYIRRGYITQAEFENLDKYLYTPYLELKGNGTVQRLMEEVQTLPIRHYMDIGEKIRNYEEN